MKKINMINLKFIMKILIHQDLHITVLLMAERARSNMLTKIFRANRDIKKKYKIFCC